ncbi:MAG TPA: magnesium transporter [Helicobacteraceae bacterium]|nr:magnesium transporter [Helicobacteraceae bacterium]
MNDLKHFKQWKLAFEEFLKDSDSNRLHASEIAFLLKKIRKEDKALFEQYIKALPEETLGEVLLELPEKAKDEAYEFLSTVDLVHAVEGLESDDAAELVQDIESFDEQTHEAVVSQLDEEDREDIDQILSFDENQAGSWMQTEFFEATLDERVQDSIDRLKALKESDEISNVHQVFIVNEDKRLIASVALEDIILFDFSKTYREQIKEKEFRYVEASMDIDEVAKLFEQYDLSAMPVLDWQGRIIGRITSDDIYDLIEERATEQIYNLAGVDDETEQEEKVVSVAYKRGIWLAINMLTAIGASFVISIFSATIEHVIALAILMPIVASMGGNAGLQALTVMVRRIALGEIDFHNAKEAIYKEVGVVLLNGFTFAVSIGLVTYLWFDSFILSEVIAIAMVLNLLLAGFVGSVVPLSLKRLDIDPAVGSSVILTVTTDVVGFFLFLGLATIMIPH